MQGTDSVKGSNGTTWMTRRGRNGTGHDRSGSVVDRRPTSGWRRLVTLIGTAALAVGTAAVPVLSAAPAAAADPVPGHVRFDAVNARTEPNAPNGATVKGEPITPADPDLPAYRYLINLDNSGKGETPKSPADGSDCSPAGANYPQSCLWPSITQDPGAAPIVAQGTSDDFAGGARIALDEGDYLVSVLADGYKLDGEHFHVDAGGDLDVTVQLQPHPLPDSTLRAQVFLDEASTNGAIDNGEPGLEGFQGHVNDTLGEITTDVYGNPLCTTYVGENNSGPNPDYSIPSSALDADGNPVVDQAGGKCFSDSTGMLTIPHLGTNRYVTYVIPPNGSGYLQTTTLEGNHDWDTWLMEGSTGYDTEFTIGGEPVPAPQFGFVKPHNDLPTTGGATVKGVVVGVKQYYPPVGGSFNYFWGSTGSKLDAPIADPILSLNDLGNGDQAVWVGRGGADGSFSIPNVPDGSYMLTWWDEPQNYILQLVQVTVANGQTVDLKQLPLTGWWTQLDGHVFLDANKNGKWDFTDTNKNGHWDAGEGEQPVKEFPLTLRHKDNSLMDRGSNAVATDIDGYYTFESAYPLSEWTVMEAYSDNFYTTGVTYQADNQPTPTTVKGAGVDISTLNIIGLSGRVDWGVQKYNASAGENGGIVGSISYDTTRNELDPQYAATEDWQPGVPNIPVKLYAPEPCPASGTPCDPTGRYLLDTDGSVKKGKLLNSYLSEHWSRPTGCTARNVDGVPLTHGTEGEEYVLADNQGTDGECIAALPQGVQIGTYATDQGTADANFGATVDGNYGFGDGCVDGTLDASDPENPTCTDGSGTDVPFTALDAGDYLVSIEVPEDASGTPEYQVTSEEDINVGRGDTVVPQVPPPSCAGPLHTVDLEGDGTDGYAQQTSATNPDIPAGVTVPGSTAVHNPTFLDMGGSPYEGTPRPRCDTKLVDLSNGKSIVPMFHLFTDVPIPSRLRGLIVDDLNFSTDNRSILLGDKAGAAHTPVGIYDFNNRLVHTVESDFNGYYDVLMPSTDHINCPTPAGVCGGMYRFVGNDPGIPGALNANYNPRFRTIATEFEAIPGVTIPTDLAPTQVGVSLGVPGSGPTTVQCLVNEAAPQLFAVSTPFIRSSAAAGTARRVTIDGYGFGDTAGTNGKVTLGSTAMSIVSWSNTRIVAEVPTTVAGGQHTLAVTGDNGKKTVNGLTFHVIGGSGSSNVNVYEVGPGGHSAFTNTSGTRTATSKYDPTSAGSQTGTAGVSHAIQNALDDAADDRAPGGARASGSDLVVVYPNAPTAGNPRGAYYENLVVSNPVKLQGTGAGGFQGPNANSPYVPGTILDGGAFGGDTDLATDWFTRVGGMTWVGNQTVSDGAVVYLLAPSSNTFSTSSSAFTPAIDGFDIRGGDQQGFPGNINDLTGQPTGLPANIVTQGGAVFANASVHQLQVTNNVVENNGGGYGTIRIGTPDLPAPDTDQDNDGVRIANNRIVQNAGTNLAGALGIFAGSNGYEVSGNDICGNFSLEYGGGVSVYGLSPDGSIHHNRITLNNSNDEGAGIMIAGQISPNPDDLSPGTGPVSIHHNRIQGNLANDDGGGIRFLQAGNFPMDVSNNVIAGNVSTHEGAGISLNDAPDVRIVNNTIMDNITTATAVTSTGIPAPVGVSSSQNSVQLQATLGTGAPTFSRPTLFNNVFWNNRAGSRSNGTVLGIGLPGDATAIDYWDVGLGDGPGDIAVANSVIQQTQGTHTFDDQGGNVQSDPKVKSAWVPSVMFATWRQNPAFVDSTLVAPGPEVPADLMGDYHLSGCPDSSACDIGALSRASVTAPTTDIDDQQRTAPLDAGADEIVQAPPPPPPPATNAFLFSTIGNATVPGVPAPADDSDAYRWDGTAYSRVVDATNYGVPASANVDGFAHVDDTHFYVSFAGDTTVAVTGGSPLAVQDEDVLYWDGNAWSVFFDGTAHGMTHNQLDVNAIGVRGGVLYFATLGAKNPPGVTGKADDADVYSWNGTSYARVLDASDYGVASNARADGAVMADATHWRFSFSSNTSLPGLGPVDDEDIVELDTTTKKWTTWFDGTAHGLTTNNHDIDAFSMPGGATAPAATP